MGKVTISTVLGYKEYVVENIKNVRGEDEGGVDGAPDPTKPIKDEENLVLIGKKEDLVKLRK